jgi:hypothetical protein
VAVPNPAERPHAPGIPGGAAWVALKVANRPRSRHVPGLHGAGSQLRRIFRQDEQHTGARRAGEEGRSLSDSYSVRAPRSGYSVPACPIFPRWPTSSKATNTTVPSCCRR